MPIGKANRPRATAHRRLKSRLAHAKPVETGWGVRTLANRVIIGV